jgi:purine nucleosidase
MRIILDTDIGTDADDALALGLALASPELELVAVTHVSGDSRARARISRRLLDLGGRPEVPVYAGCDLPRSRDNQFAWFGYEGKGITDSGPPLTVAGEHAVAALIRLVRSDADVELVGIGPLTNVAAALTEAPDIVRRIKRLTLMGGYVRRVACGGGIVSPMVDYNLRIDVESSRIVLTSGIPILMVPTDVTVQVWITETQVRQLEQSSSDLLHSIARNIRDWSPLQRRIFTHLGAHLTPDNVGFLHDPLALACAFDESFCTIEDLTIELVMQDGILRTIERPTPIPTPNTRHPTPPSTHQLRVATTVDAPRFQQFLCDRLMRLARG